MIKQYPHTLLMKVVAGGGFDANGHAVEGAADWKELCRCRDEHNSKANVITGQDGIDYKYAFTVFMPVGMKPIATGVQIKVVDDAGNVRMEGQVMNFRNGQLNSQLWV